MAKMKSTLSNMLLSLTVIALVAAGLLAGVYEMTKDTIAATNAKKQQAAIIAVLPQADGLEIAEAEEAEGMEIYRASVAGEPAGAAVKVAENGFGGTFHVMVGFDAEGAISGFEVLDHQETPGLGSKMQEWFHNPQVIGQKVGETNFTVSKDGGDVDAITAATISSRAFLLAVTKAYNAYLAGKLQPADAESGATALAAEENVEPENVEE